MNKQSNAEDFERTRKTLGIPMIVELILRGGALVLALLCIISASVTLNTLEPLPEDSGSKAMAGWTVFLSLAVFFYQIFAILQLFWYLKVLYMKIPVGNSLWYLFPLIDIVVNIICIIGYTPTAIAAAVYSYQRMSSGSLNDGLPIAFTSIFAFGSVVRFIVMIGVIILAKSKFKWPNYFIPEN